jgi:hypothetical protein
MTSGEDHSSAPLVSKAVFSAWQSDAAPPPASSVYVPQRGDDVVYFARAHRHLRDEFKHQERLPAEANTLWPDAVRCRVVAVLNGALKHWRYTDLLLQPIVGGDDADARLTEPPLAGDALPPLGSNGPPPECVRPARELSTLRFAAATADARADAAYVHADDAALDAKRPRATPFVVRHVPCASEPEFVVLTRDVRRSCSSALRDGARCRSFFADRERWFSGVVKRVHTLRSRPADVAPLLGDARTLWECCEVQFDQQESGEPGNLDHLSPWDIDLLASPADDDVDPSTASTASTRLVESNRDDESWLGPRARYELSLLLQATPALTLLLDDLMHVSRRLFLDVAMLSCFCLFFPFFFFVFEQTEIGRVFASEVDLLEFPEYTEKVTTPVCSSLCSRSLSPMTYTLNYR